MTKDSASWIAAEAGFPLIEDAGEGRIRANDAGLVLLRGHTWRGLVDAALRISGRDPAATPDRELHALRRVVDTVREGRVSASARIGPTGWLCLGMPGGPGRARLLLVPGDAARTAELSRRAAAVDLAAEVSHEVANALGAISGVARRAQHRLDQGAADLRSTRTALAVIEGRARDAQETSRKLLATARGDVPAETLDAGTHGTDLAGLLQEIAELLAPVAARSGIQVDLFVEPGLRVAAPRADLFTVVWNLAKNAVEALGPGGRLSLELQSPEGDDQVVLHVTDDGPGVPAEELGRLFEPYYTTKDDGTGLGLPLVRRTVEELGGSLNVVSRPGIGTRFTVTLRQGTARAGADQGLESSPGSDVFGVDRSSGPERVPRRHGPERTSDRPSSVVRPAGPRSVTVAAGARRDSGVLDRPLELSARVLVLDDDEPLRDVLQTALELRGAYVVVADGPTRAALAQGPFDVAIVDQHLGALRGDRVLDDLRASGAARAGVLMSGGSIPPGAVGGAAPPDAWLRKPFDPDEVVGILRNVLDATTPGRTATQG